MKPRGGEDQNGRLKCPLGFLVIIIIIIIIIIITIITIFKLQMQKVYNKTKLQKYDYISLILSEN